MRVVLVTVLLIAIEVPVARGAVESVAAFPEDTPVGHWLVRERPFQVVARSPALAPSRGGPGPEVGIVSGSDRLFDAGSAPRLGARLARVEFPIGTPVAGMRAVVDRYARSRARVLLLAGFPGRLPSAPEARNLGAWAREFGPGGRFWAGRSDGHLAVSQIEFGNETSYAYQGTQRRGGAYARRFRLAHGALAGAGGNPRVGLLAQADDGDVLNSTWVRDMFAAVPDLASRVGGFTVHPYGPRTRWQPRLDRLVAQTAAHGAPSTIPIDVTEWGVANDGGRCLSDNYHWNRCMDSGDAARALRATLAGMRASYGSRLRTFLIFQARDRRPSRTSRDREQYFGALGFRLTPKGAYTAEVRRQVARSGPRGSRSPAGPSSSRWPKRAGGRTAVSVASLRGSG